MSEHDGLGRAIVHEGRAARLNRVMQRAQRGLPLRVGVIGGSITQGAAASTAENRWANRVAQWWRTTFPKAEVSLVNAGIGATGSNIGAHRVAADLLAHEPDFVVVEYAVNDHELLVAETFEGLIRQILGAQPGPAVLLLFTMTAEGGNRQAIHSRVGRHYGLPMVSVRDALWPEMRAGRMAWADYSPDTVHPNDFGHRWCAACVTHLLDRIRQAMPARVAQRRPARLPRPLTSDIFEHTHLFTAATLRPVRCEGWTEAPTRKFGPGWVSDTPGSILEFELTGRTLSLVHWKIKGDMGMARVQVGDAAPVEMDGWFDADWGGYSNWTLAAHALPAAGPHRLRIDLLAKRARASAGHRFELQAVLAAGTG
ncbi:MAG: SGNH/GDSL hydrolase family protein [Kiritimatiellae bacterium]|nr:SGNH/GDSL hydrolase family protein [Kiritimatiellia bacterium]